MAALSSVDRDTPLIRRHPTIQSGPAERMPTCLSVICSASVGCHFASTTQKRGRTLATYEAATWCRWQHSTAFHSQRRRRVVGGMSTEYTLRPRTAHQHSSKPICDQTTTRISLSAVARSPQILPSGGHGDISDKSSSVDDEEAAAVIRLLALACRALHHLVHHAIVALVPRLCPFVLR